MNLREYIGIEKNNEYNKHSTEPEKSDKIKLKAIQNIIKPVS